MQRGALGRAVWVAVLVAVLSLSAGRVPWEKEREGKTSRSAPHKDMDDDQSGRHLAAAEP